MNERKIKQQQNSYPAKFRLVPNYYKTIANYNYDYNIYNYMTMCTSKKTMIHKMMIKVRKKKNPVKSGKIWIFSARRKKNPDFRRKNRIYIVNESKEYDPSLTL